MEAAAGMAMVVAVAVAVAGVALRGCSSEMKMNRGELDSDVKIGQHIG